MLLDSETNVQTGYRVEWNTVYNPDLPWEKQETPQWHTVAFVESWSQVSDDDAYRQAMAIYQRHHEASPTLQLRMVSVRRIETLEPLEVA